MLELVNEAKEGLPPMDLRSKWRHVVDASKEKFVTAGPLRSVIELVDVEGLFRTQTLTASLDVDPFRLEASFEDGAGAMKLFDILTSAFKA